jgi:glyoxylase-like metal-dependent hydrolase (beta-lactamase superfamily II)
MRVGRWEAATLEFGRFRLDGGAMFGVVPRVIWEREAPPDELNRIPLALRCLLLRDGERVALVDCGVGDKDGPAFREMFALADEGSTVTERLAQHGLAPEEVTDLILTHLHFDHAGGAVTRNARGESVPTFPRAVIHLQRRQWDWAQSPSPRDRASYLRENLEPLRQARLNLLDGPAEPLPGIHLLPVEGHTPGMQVVEVDGAGGPSLVYCADLVPTVAHLPLAWVMGYDLFPLTVVEEKAALYQRHGMGSSWLVFEHDPAVAAARVDASGRRPLLLETRERLVGARGDR